MKVLHVTPSFYPATYWGGPVFSTKAICDGIAARPGFDLRVETTDSAGPRSGDRVAPACLPYPVHYAARRAGHAMAPGLLARLPQAIARAEVVHLTGAYNAPTLPTLALCRALGRPLVWSPRGALLATQDWADAPRRRAKRVFHGAVAALLPARMVIHATCDAEAQVARRLFPRAGHSIIANAVTIPASCDRPVRDGHLRLMSLGRLHPKKGIDLVIAAMAKLPGHVTLDIYGDGPAPYVDALQRQAAALEGRVRFHGAVEATAKTAAFHAADLFVLPSHSENFGIVVAEALAHGVPVLTTRATPWQGVMHHDCGLVIADPCADLAADITALAARDLRAMGARGRAWMMRDFCPEAMVAQFAALYRGMAVGRPDMVPA